MVRQAPEIKHVVQAAVVGREARDVAARSSYRPELMARLRVQNIDFPPNETHQLRRLHNHLTHTALTRTASAPRARIPSNQCSIPG